MNNKAYGTHEIAKICNVTPPTVGRWLEEGKLPYFTTGGGHRRVWAQDLAVFIKQHNIPCPSEISETLPGIRILIVDDEKPVRVIIRRVAEKLYTGAEISEAEDGYEAGTQTASSRFSLIILDMRLPGIDGVKICRTVRKSPAGKDTKILAISGYEPGTAASAFKKAGADDFLAKPFTITQLEEKMTSLLTSSELK